MEIATQSSAELTLSRFADNSAGEETPICWPEEAELYELVLSMLTGGSGVAAAPGKSYAPAKATYTLLVRVKTVVQKAKKEHGGAFHIVAGTSGRIDQQEARGYLLGAVLGRGLLTREEAAAAGLDARNKLNALERRLADQKEAARKAGIIARKAGQEALEKHLTAAQREREGIERERIELALPSPHSTLAPPRAPKRARETEPEKWHHFADGQCTPWEVAADARLAQAERRKVAEKAMEAAELAEDAARSTLTKADAALDALETAPSISDYIRAGAAESRRLDALEAQHDRTWAKYDVAWQAHEDAVASLHAACDETRRQCELEDRMDRWLARPDRLTPFPWPGEEFIEPCNQRDLDYYVGRPDAYPPGVHEWHVRFHAL